MSQHGFISVFAAELDAYVAFKKNMGFSGASRIWYLKRFDAYCAEQDRVVFDQDTVEGWVVAELDRSGRYRSWMSYIRGFGRWLQANVVSDAYVLTEAWKASFVPARPYLLSRQEIDLFFETAAALEVPSPWRWQAAAFFTLMYSCGLRTGEVRSLQADQVNLDDGHIDVVWSKGNRSRRLPLTGQVIKVLDTCDRASSARFASRGTFFVSAAGTPVTPAAVGVTLWPHLGPSRPGPTHRWPPAPAIRPPPPFRLRQHRAMDEPGQRCRCDAALPVALHGACVERHGGWGRTGQSTSLTVGRGLPASSR
jgi:integrase